MGKPKKRDSRTSSNVSGGITIKSRKTRKMRKKQRQCIEKIYNNLRASSSTTVTSGESQPQNRSPRKRKRANNSIDSPQAKRKPEDVIVIKDDDDTPIKQPKITSSTPYHNVRNNESELNISEITVIEDLNNKELELHSQIQDLTAVVNQSSLVTIDLTGTPSTRAVAKDNHKDSTDCTIVSVSNSDVTVIERPVMSKSQERLQEFSREISKMNASEKGKLLDMITAKIFGGCNVQKRLGGKQSSTATVASTRSRAVETAEDTYIKEMILGQTPSACNSIGSNIYNPVRDTGTRKGKLRMVVVDGSNVAMEHGQHREFSVKGLKICLDYFVKRGHVVKAFVPRFRCKFGKSSNPRLLDDLERQGLVIYTPSREVQGRLITPYDDRYIIQCAAEFDGVIVSGDNYRDLLHENPRWRRIIETRLLPFTWVEDMIMFPKDPLGRNGPTLEQFLKHT